MEWILLFGIGSSCYVIFKIIVSYYESDGSKVNKYWRYTIGVSLILLSYGSLYYYEETTKIKDGGIYYVNLFEKIDDQKNYRVPAKIFKDEDGFILGEIYWSNGGRLSFDNEYEHIVLDEKVKVRDDEKKYWYVELTNKKAEYKSEKEKQ